MTDVYIILDEDGCTSGRAFSTRALADAYVDSMHRREYQVLEMEVDAEPVAAVPQLCLSHIGAYTITGGPVPVFHDAVTQETTLYIDPADRKSVPPYAGLSFNGAGYQRWAVHMSPYAYVIVRDYDHAAARAKFKELIEKGEREIRLAAAKGVGRK